MSRYDPNEIDPAKVEAGYAAKAAADAQTIKRLRAALGKYVRLDHDVIGMPNYARKALYFREKSQQTKRTKR